MCEAVFELGRSTVDRLLRAVKIVSEARYAELEPARVDALLELALATEADDTEEVLAEAAQGAGRRRAGHEAAEEVREQGGSEGARDEPGSAVSLRCGGAHRSRGRGDAHEGVRPRPETPRAGYVEGIRRLRQASS